MLFKHRKGVRRVLLSNGKGWEECLCTGIGGWAIVFKHEEGERVLFSMARDGKSVRRGELGED